LFIGLDVDIPLISRCFQCSKLHNFHTTLQSFFPRQVREIWCSKPSILIYKSFSHYWFSSLSSNTNINISIKRLESMLAVAIINMKKWSFVFGLLIWKNWSLLSMLNQVRELCPAVFNATFNHISVISWQSNWSHEIQHMLIHST
jgi:hypothetical protein